jgi:1-acyl-sn-glycerol-3-phosphate acyltransferase
VRSTPYCGEADIKSWQTIGEDVPSSGNSITRFLGRLLLNSTGWTLQGDIPNKRQFIIAVAPHTSNFDFMLTVGVIWSLGLKASFLAKRSLFRFPLGYVIRGFGGIPVDRDRKNGVVEDMATHFANNPKLILGIAPEGTRRAVTRWRSGFALIAQAANVPVLPAIISYREKVVTFKSLIEDVGDADHTLAMMQQAAASGSGRGT